MTQADEQMALSRYVLPQMEIYFRVSLNTLISVETELNYSVH